MSAPQHTPGPWQSMHDFDREGELTIVGNVDGEIIDGHMHHTYILVTEVYEVDDRRGETSANARLIAAAPELLEALEAILKVRVEGWENIWAGSNRCQDIARAAIAKARGQ